MMAAVGLYTCVPTSGSDSSGHSLVATRKTIGTSGRYSSTSGTR